MFLSHIIRKCRRFATERARRKGIRLVCKRTHSCIDAATLIDGKTILEDNIFLSGGDFSSASVGRHTFAGRAYFPNCKIGRFCSIAGGSHLVIGRHPLDFVSTWPGFFRTRNGKVHHFNDEIDFDEAPLLSNGFYSEIGNDVWLGQDCAIMCGVKIGDGAVVGTGALVTKDVPPYAVVGGVPSKIIRFRFDEKTRDALLKIRWWDWDDDTIRAFAPFFSSPELLLNELQLGTTTLPRKEP